MVGAPAKALDFGTELLNLGNTLGTLLSFTAGNYGLGKAYSFSVGSCSVLSYRDRERLMWTLEPQSALNTMQVLRNPVAGIDFDVQLKRFAVGSYKLELFNTVGKLMFTKKFKVTGTKQTVSLSRAGSSSGVYSIHILDTQNKPAAVKRIVFN